MSHRIIISSAIVSGSPDGLNSPVLASGSAVGYNIEYVPAHDLTEAQIGQEVARIIRQAKKMQESGE